MHERASLDVGIRGNGMLSKTAALRFKMTERTDLNIGIAGNESVDTMIGVRVRM
jgi:hypothetical protein